MFLSTLTTMLLVLFPASPGEEPPETEALVETIAARGLIGRDPTPVLDTLKVLRNSLNGSQQLDESSRKRLMRVVENPQANALVRKATLKLLCDQASSESAERTLTLMVSLVARLHNVRDHHDPEFYAIPGLLYGFVAEGAKPLASRLKKQTLLLDFYADILKDPRIHHQHIRSSCLERIADSPAPLIVRQDYMFRFVKVNSDRPSPEAFFVLVNDDVIDRLRRLAFECPSGIKGYNMAAVGLLAEYGDVETASKLDELFKSQGYNREAIMRPGGYVWMIESQHNPQLLLDHISSNEWIDNHTRLWSLKKAIHLRADRAKIRSALLEHALHVGKDKRLLYDFVQLKKLALQAGVVSPGDLPDVEMPTWPHTP